MNCIFCDTNRIKENIIFETEFVYCLADQFPASEGHSLIVTKNHYPSLLDIPEITLIEIIKSIRHIIEVLKDIYIELDFNIIYCEGEDAAQGIKHMHWHIIPRHKNDSIEIKLNENLDNKEFRKLRENYLKKI